jgi:hypothetical protein
VVRLGFRVAKHVTAAVYTFAKSWIFGQPSAPPPTEEEKANNESQKITPVRLALKLSLSDPGRNVRSISLCPSRTYAAMTDNFGRVLLLDVEMMTVVRIWKGYRNARCGWLSDPSFGGFFLAIYAPMRGLLEVWKCPNGPRIGARNLGEENAHGLSCHLFSRKDGLLFARTYLVRLRDGFTREIQISKDFSAAKYYMHTTPQPAANLSS